MTDRIEPALTAKQWTMEETAGRTASIERDGFTRDDLSRNGYQLTPESRVVLSIGDETFHQDELPALIALANAALPDSDPRKITHRKIAQVRQLSVSGPYAGVATLLQFLDALSSYLPPEEP